MIKIYIYVYIFKSIVMLPEDFNDLYRKSFPVTA